MPEGSLDHTSIKLHRVGKSTPVQGLSAKIVELLSVKPASLNISLVGEPAAEIAIIVRNVLPPSMMGL